MENSGLCGGMHPAAAAGGIARVSSDNRCSRGASASCQVDGYGVGNRKASSASYSKGSTRGSSSSSSSSSCRTDGRKIFGRDEGTATISVGSSGGSGGSSVGDSSTGTNNSNSLGVGVYSSGAGVQNSKCEHVDICSISPNGAVRDDCVFLTAYHERSARRSLRPLLKKWGLVARVLPGAPRNVLPHSAWETGKYDSVAILEIRLR
ncbi:unnamed protein product [Sphacelaria rigidula]